jgi:membrane-associated phospholipid phosphatase
LDERADRRPRRSSRRASLELAPREPKLVRFAGAFLIACSLASAGCHAAEPGTWWEHHVDGSAWSQGFDQLLEEPAQIAPTLSLLALTPAVAMYDRDLSDWAKDHHPLTGGITISGDLLSAGLAVSAGATGAVEALRGDQGRSIEVAVESILATSAVTQFFKFAVQRIRPGSDSTDSFPSAHTSTAFAGATFLFRRMRDEWEGPAANWSWLAYAPAAYVAIDRVESGRHFPSDVAFGAFLGVFLTNWIYDAHYGDDRHPERHAIYRRAPHAAWSLGPALIDDHLALSLAISF